MAQVHLRHLNPMPANLGDVLRRYDTVVCPELNLGQLALLLRAEFLVDVRSITQVRGQPFGVEDLSNQIRALMDGDGATARTTNGGTFGGPQETVEAQ